MEKYVTLDQAVTIARMCAKEASFYGSNCEYLIENFIDRVKTVSLPITRCSECKHCYKEYFPDGDGSVSPVYLFCNQFHVSVSDNFYCGAGDNENER